MFVHGCYLRVSYSYCRGVLCLVQQYSVNQKYEKQVTVFGKTLESHPDINLEHLSISPQLLPMVFMYLMAQCVGWLVKIFVTAHLYNILCNLCFDFFTRCSLQAIMNAWQIFTLGVLVFSVCSASEQCTDPLEQDDDKPSGSCGCGATSRTASAAPSDSAETSPVLENNEESPNYKYSKEANPVKGVPRTNQMVHIPGGKFIMGTNEPVFPADGEHPARWVEIDDFFMDVYEVSNAEFQLFVLANKYVTEVGMLAAVLI